MFSDGMSGKALVECHKSISENKDNSSDVNNNIFQDCEKVSFELAISKSRGFTQDDREYVNNNFEGKMFSKKIRNLINDVLKLTYSNLPPSTCTTSCGAILNALSDLREYQINEMGIEDPEFCFITPDGKIISPDRVLDFMKAVVADAGIRQLTVHELRHTYATNLFHDTKEIYYVSKQLGHTNINTTRRYIEQFQD